MRLRSSTYFVGLDRMIMTLEQIVTSLQDRRPTVVADAIGVRAATIIDLREGRTRNPSYDTVKALSDYLSRDVGA